MPAANSTACDSLTLHTVLLHSSASVLIDAAAIFSSELDAVEVPPNFQPEIPSSDDVVFNRENLTSE